MIVFFFLLFIFPDQRLDNSLIYEQEVDSIMDCAHLCLSQYPQCRSINYEKAAKKEDHKRRKCQLNNETRTTKPEEMVPDIAFNYFEPIMVILNWLTVIISVFGNKFLNSQLLFSFFISLSCYRV